MATENETRPRVHIKSRQESDEATGGYLYELEPTNYDGPWDLEEGTELEVVSEVETCDSSQRKEDQ